MFPADFLKTTPHSPGVYLMLDKKSVILYVGKAKDLQKRLSSYVRFSGAEHNKTTVMLGRVDRVETIITRTEKEALILEASNNINRAIILSVAMIKTIRSSRSPCRRNGHG